MGYDQKFVVLQQYDKDMKKTSSVDNDGNFSYTEFNADGDIVSYSTNEDNAVNLIPYGDFSSDSGWEQNHDYRRQGCGDLCIKNYFDNFDFRYIWFYFRHKHAFFSNAFDRCR